MMAEHGFILLFVRVKTGSSPTVFVRVKAGVERCSFQTKNQMVFVKKTHCKMWLCFDMVGHRRVIKGTDIRSVMHIHELIIHRDFDPL